MRIQSPQTRRDLEIAAELRAAGASWDTAAAVLHRQPHLLSRWSRVYFEEWQRLLAQAEERQAHTDAESRSALRKRLQSRDANTRVEAATNLMQQRLDEMAAQSPAQVPTDPAAFKAHVEQMNAQELDGFLTNFFDNLYAKRTATMSDSIGEPGT
jgi:hypothetical protein